MTCLGVCRSFTHDLLQVLQLSHNAMEVLPIALLSLTALTYLDLSYNRLMALPFWIGSSKLQQLRRLNLVSSVPRWFCLGWASVHQGGSFDKKCADTGQGG